MADVVYIASREYTFKFDKKEELGMVIPIWTDRYPVTEGWTTFTLELSADTAIDSLATHLKDIQPSLLLFLRKLEHIQVIVDGVKGQFDCTQLRGEPGITRLTRQQGGQRSIEDYLIVKGITQTYAQEPKREGIVESELVLAFPVSADRTPIIQDRAVHAFLPIRTHSIPVCLYNSEYSTQLNIRDGSFDLVHYSSRFPTCGKSRGHFSRFKMEYDSSGRNTICFLPRRQATFPKGGGTYVQLATVRPRDLLRQFSQTSTECYHQRARSTTVFTLRGWNSQNTQTSYYRG